MVYKGNYRRSRDIIESPVLDTPCADKRCEKCLQKIWNPVVWYRLYRYIETENKMNSNPLGTSKLADKAGVNKETLRFYEKKGLLAEPVRTDGGYRQYSEKDLDRLLFIKNAKELGFSLAEIKELLAIADGDIYKCCDVRQIAESKLDHINHQMKHLKKLRKTLASLVTECQSTTTIKHCPIIESLSHRGNMK